MTTRVYFVIRLSSLSMNELTAQPVRGCVCVRKMCLARKRKEADAEETARRREEEKEKGEKQKGRARTAIVSHSWLSVASVCLVYCTNCPVMDMTAMSLYPTPQLYRTTKRTAHTEAHWHTALRTTNTQKERERDKSQQRIHICYYLLFICHRRY